MLVQRKTLILTILGIIYYFSGMAVGEIDAETSVGRIIELAAILTLALKGNRVENKIDTVSDGVNTVDRKVNRVGSNISTVGGNVNIVDDKVDTVDQKIDSVDSKVDKL